MAVPASSLLHMQMRNIRVAPKTWGLEMPEITGAKCHDAVGGRHGRSISFAASQSATVIVVLLFQGDKGANLERPIYASAQMCNAEHNSER